MGLQFVRPSLAKHRSITPCLCVIDHHRFFKELKAIDFVDSASGRVDTVKYDKRLSLRLQVRLRDDFDDGPIFRENLFECLFQLVDFNAFF